MDLKTEKKLIKKHKLFHFVAKQDSVKYLYNILDEKLIKKLLTDFYKKKCPYKVIIYTDLIVVDNNLYIEATSYDDVINYKNNKHPSFTNTRMYLYKNKDDIKMDKNHTHESFYDFDLYDFDNIIKHSKSYNDISLQLKTIFGV